MGNNYHKAYKEVLHILDATPKELVDKIPKNILDVFEECADKDYKCEFDPHAENLDVLEETENILGMIYYNYWCESEEEKKAFEKAMAENEANIGKITLDNGRVLPIISYLEEFGDIEWESGFEEQLQGKTLEQQVKCYAITWDEALTKKSYKEITEEDLHRSCNELARRDSVKKLIVKEGILVGVVFEGYMETVNLLPGKGVCINYTYSDYGPMYEIYEHYDYSYLICLKDTEHKE